MVEFSSRPITDERRVPTAARWLGYGGVAPFAVGALGVWLLEAELALGAVRLTIGYGALILAFLGGVRWGAALRPLEPGERAQELALSVVPMLAGFVALLPPPVVALALLISALVVQALWDIMAVQRGLLPGWYGSLRIQLTAGAGLSLALALAGVLAL